MKITNITNWETWKELCEERDFNPYQTGAFGKDEGSSTDYEYKYIGDFPRKEVIKMRKREEILSANPIKGTIPFSESMSQILLLEVLLDIRELLAGFEGRVADKEKEIEIPEPRDDWDDHEIPFLKRVRKTRWKKETCETCDWCEFPAPTQQGWCCSNREVIRNVLIGDRRENKKTDKACKHWRKARKR